ncbi:MAG: hypothetical protein JHC93_05080 [Parachlamydiales bacterium]|nr:hypothetical protein [Parachlamydiales bacterium]
MLNIFQWLTSSHAQNLGGFLVGVTAILGITFGMLEISLWRRKKFEERRAETAATMLSYISDVLLDLEDLLKYKHQLPKDQWKKDWSEIYDQFKKAKAKSILLGDRSIYQLFDKLHRKIRMVPHTENKDESLQLLLDCNPLFEELELELLGIAYLGHAHKIKVCK